MRKPGNPRTSPPPSFVFKAWTGSSPERSKIMEDPIIVIIPPFWM